MLIFTIFITFVEFAFFLQWLGASAITAQGFNCFEETAEVTDSQLKSEKQWMIKRSY